MQARKSDATMAGQPDIQTVLRLVRTDPDFRKELRDVIFETLQPEIDKLREELAASASERTKLDPQTIIQREFPGAQLSQWTHQDTQGQVYGFPETIEVDVIKHNNMSYLCSIRESIDIADVVFLIRIGRLYKSIHPQGALACVIVSREISPRAKAIADRCKMKCIIQS